MISQILYAQVVVKATARVLDRPFTYLVPTELVSAIKIGSIVEAPFRTNSLVGFVISLERDLPEEALGHEIKPLTRLLNDKIYWSEELLELSRFMSSYYGCRWIESLQAVIPAPVLKKVIDLLKVKGSPKNRSNNFKRLPVLSSAIYESPRSLTDEQENAVRAIEESCRGGPPVLLYGITGSGKTEVYLNAISRCLERGRQSIVLIPEVSLTYQAIQRYRGRLGDTVGVINSALSATERQAYWWAMNEGKLNVALGTRSAIFAPLRDIGLIVIDEEHENSYKQENSPRYHARQVAFLRARRHKSGLVYGSATPSLESFYLAKSGRYRLVELSRRPLGQSLPTIHLVDMRRSGKRSKMISPPLSEAIRQRIADRQQVVLFLNRRGFSKFLQCNDCGKLIGCPRCSIPLTFHKTAMKMRCHYCGYTEYPPDICPHCESLNFRHGSGGTERLLNEVKALVPEATIVRMDRDTTGKIGSHETILKKFASGEAQILLGTKMITKGLDYPNVTLVGVINGDDELNLPDFRASERCFQMLTQVSGRAGRGSIPGEVYLQVHSPEQLAVQAALTHDYIRLYEAEIAERRKLMYPPFCRLVRVIMSSKDELAASVQAEELGRFLCSQNLNSAQVIGPAPCPLERLEGKYRYHVLIKCGNSQIVVELIKDYLKMLAKKRSTGGVNFTIDPEPQNLS